MGEEPKKNTDKKEQKKPQQQPKGGNNAVVEGSAKGSVGFITQYFLVIMFLFAGMSFMLNIHVSSRTKHHGQHDMARLQHTLKEQFMQSRSSKLKLEQEAQEEIIHADHLNEQEEEEEDDDNDAEQQHRLAGLSCDKFGGPTNEEAVQEMVYWSDIPSDNKHVSPFKKPSNEPQQYLTFEPDHGGWNNIRMSMETVLGMAFAMGRTLVLPPETKLYLLGKQTNDHKVDKKDKKQRHHFSFNHFFHMESIHNEHPGLDIITMDQFLQETAMKGLLRNKKDNRVRFPPKNRTDWNGCDRAQIKDLWVYLRDVSHTLTWSPNDCMATIPASTNPNDIQLLNDIKQGIDAKGGFPTYQKYVGKPFPVNASTSDRMQENWAGRKELCVYDSQLQQEELVHFPTDPKLEARLLVHFYAFLFFQDWKQDLWMKRFVRDHVRYIDEIQCAAARVIEAVRQRVKQRQPDKNPKGEFDSFHIRRGEFQYKVTRLEASEIYDISKEKLTPGDTVYISTDERDKSFFQPLKDHYDVVFLDDFIDVLGRDVNTNYYGMIDQLIASKGRVFFGCWFSTFTGYINRLRGYHWNKDKLPGYEQGIINSWYYALEDRYDHMQEYYPVKQAYYAREFPTSWRLIDESVGMGY